MLTPKKKIRIGDSVKVNNIHYVVEELFVADFTRWVRCTSHRKKGTVTYRENTERKIMTYYDTNNHYFTEREWIRKIACK